MNCAESSKLGEVWVFGRMKTQWHRDQMVATWFNDLVQTAHTGTSTETGWNLLGTVFTMNLEGFCLKVKGSKTTSPFLTCFMDQMMNRLIKK